MEETEYENLQRRYRRHLIFSAIAALAAIAAAVMRIIGQRAFDFGPVVMLLLLLVILQKHLRLVKELKQTKAV